MADAFQPRFVDLVRNTTTTQGTGNFVLGAAATGFTSFTAALQPGDSFYYSAIGVDKPAEREVGRGTLQANGSISRSPLNGPLTNFSSGTKTIALIAASEWYSQAQQLIGGTSRFASTFADRSSLAAGPAGTVAYLSESGREGPFVWSAANLSGLVAADARQGLCVPPASDLSGASGAWLRRWERGINVRWFGAVGDDATDDGAAFLAAIAAANYLATSGYGYGKGAPRLYVPAGKFFLGTATLDLTNSIIVEGESCGGPSGAASLLRWSDGVTGIRTQSWNSSGASGPSLVTGYTGAPMATIRNLSLIGGFAGSESESHGIQLRCKAVIRDVFIQGFGGDGIFARASSTSAAWEGNDNDALIDNVFITGCRNGIYVSGLDANAILIVNPNCNSNRKWGVHFDQTIGSNIVGGDMSSNGQIAGFPTMVSAGGHYYYCLAGQETWCSANAPSGTTTSNQGWVYCGDGAAVATRPAWASGAAYRAGGPVRIEGDSSYCTVTGLYSEIDQGPAQLDGHVLWMSPLGGDPVLTNGESYGGQLIGNTAALFTRRGLVVGDTVNSVPGVSNMASTLTLQGDAYLTRANGNVYDPTLHINTTNAYATINFEFQGAQSGVVQYDHSNGFVYWLASAGHAHNYYVGGTHVATIGSNGLAVSSGSLGYGTGAGGAVTQTTSRTTGVTLNKACGQITLVSAPGSAAWQTFTVTNSLVAATDSVRVVQASGVDAYQIHVTRVGAGSFDVTFATTGGTTTEQPVFNFAVVKAVAA